MKKKKDEITIRSSAAEYLTYIASIGDQQDSIEMRYEDENIWLTQKMMATLYDVGLPTINEHIKKIYADSELEESATIRNFRIVQTEGSRQVTRDTKHYNLQMIIAVGFKVNNERAVQFRKWANGIVKDYTIKGWVMDDERLKNGGSLLFACRILLPGKISTGLSGKLRQRKSRIFLRLSFFPMRKAYVYSVCISERMTMSLLR